jgi:hypothetical protein
MKLRDWINNNTPLVTVIALVIVVGAIGYIFYSQRTPTFRQPNQYFYDLGSAAPDHIDRLFPAKAQIPPIDAPSGKVMDDGSPAGVGASVFACGGCDDKSQRFIAYLETYTPEAKQAMLNPGPIDPSAAPPPGGGGVGPGAMGPMAAANGHLVRRVEDTRWYSFMSREGAQIVMEATRRCPEGTPPMPCLPDGK